MADITEIKSTDRVIEALHPGTGAKVGIQLTLMSVDDERLKTVRRKFIDDRMHAEARGKTIKAEQIEENQITLNSAAITGWNWYNPTGNEGEKGYEADAMPTFHGEVPEFNRKNVRAVMTEVEWLRHIVTAEFSDTKAFFQP